MALALTLILTCAHIETLSHFRFEFEEVKLFIIINSMYIKNENSSSQLLWWALFKLTEDIFTILFICGMVSVESANTVPRQINVFSSD